MISTKYKILGAKLLYNIVMFFRNSVGASNETFIKRKGINWKLDLREGIDFSIFLLGAFEGNTLKAYSKLIKKGDVVLDIGANCGSHTLHFAQLVGEQGKVIAFEPTDFAYQKLVQNLSLNTEIQNRVIAKQVLLCSANNRALPQELYSSWPLVNADDCHEMHCGAAKKTTGAIAKTLDEIVDESAFLEIDFIKLDVDGYEPEILEGAYQSLQKYRPLILMELAPSYYKGNFEAMIENFSKLNYKIQYLNSKKTIPLSVDYIKNLIPTGCSLNILLKPQ